MLSDEDIADRVIKGEKHLYEGLMRKYNLRLFRICFSIVNDDMAVEDIMQTAYLNAYLNLAKFQNRSSFSTWLTRILINESLLYKKKKLKRELLLAEKQENNYLSETPLNGLMNKELKVLLEKTIADLPEKYKIVFVMREIEEMSTNETMGVLNISESNVKIRLNRAKEMLRGNLSAYYKSNQLYEFNLIRCDRIVNFVMEQINAGTTPGYC
jgi:RNA polymerase sigma factor (sigma-70 family)